MKPMKPALTYILRLVLVIVPLAVGVAAGWRAAMNAPDFADIPYVIIATFGHGVFSLVFAVIAEGLIFAVGYLLLHVIRGRTLADLGKALPSPHQLVSTLSSGPAPTAFGTPDMQHSDEHVRPRRL
jgi:ABC-type dipeptide/oligopeptide/nickel transport system permease component